MVDSYALEADELVNALGDMEFGKLFGPDEEEWWDFVRERIALGADQVGIRISFDDPDTGLWFLWAYFNVENDTLTLDGVMLPKDADHNLVTPTGYEMTPVFYTV
jgi:hypothetical protein